VAPITWTPTGRESLLSIAGRALSRSRLATAAVLRVVLRFLLIVAGLTLISAAAWTVALWLGLTVAGLSCLILEWAVKR
jgi:hypothetical protein